HQQGVAAAAAARCQAVPDSEQGDSGCDLDGFGRPDTRPRQGGRIRVATGESSLEQSFGEDRCKRMPPMDVDSTAWVLDEGDPDRVSEVLCLQSFANAWLDSGGRR